MTNSKVKKKIIHINFRMTSRCKYGKDFKYI